MQRQPFSAELLRIDCKKEVENICVTLREGVLRRHKKKGLVVAISGGVDSSVVAALAVVACGKDKVLGLQMPERHSSSETLNLSRVIAQDLGIDSVQEDITEILEAAGCYRR